MIDSLHLSDDFDGRIGAVTFFLGPAGKITNMMNPAHGGKCERETLSDFY